MSLSSDSDTDANDVVSFPPCEHADFVVHYDLTDFHVHKIVLHHHSAYFKAYFHTASASSSGSSSPVTNRTLPSDTQPGSGPSLSSSTSSKRARLDTPPSSPDSGSQSARKSKSTQSSSSSSSSDGSSAPSHHCDHPSIAHCIHLPQQTRLVEKTPITAAELELFLRHLYFGAHYCYPPYLPQTDIDLDAHPPPLSISFPGVPSIDWSTKSPQLRFTNATAPGFVSDESLLALAHYLDCAAMLAQCEAVLATTVGAEQTKGAWLVQHSLMWLRYADRYHLSLKRQSCIEVIAAADKAILQNAAYKAAKQEWYKELLMDLFEASIAK